MDDLPALTNTDWSAADQRAASWRQQLAEDDARRATRLFPGADIDLSGRSIANLDGPGIGGESTGGVNQVIGVWANGVVATMQVNGTIPIPVL